MARKPKPKFQKVKAAYRTPALIETNTEEGRGLLWTQRKDRAKIILEIDRRKKKRDLAFGFIDGTYAERSLHEKVYLNEALPALEDMIFGTVPALPPVEVEARQLEHEDTAIMVAALLDQVLTSGLSRALPALIAAEWDEIGWGIGFTKTTWHVEDKQSPLILTKDEAYLTPHVELAMWENDNIDQAQVVENDDDFVHLQIHRSAPELVEHIAAHEERLGRLKIAHPVIRRVAPDRMLYDPDAEEWADRDYEMEFVMELVSSLQQIPGIKNLTPENCPSVDEFDQPNLRYTDSEGPPNSFDFEKTKVGVWHIHDRVNHTYTMLPAVSGSAKVKPILETDWPYGAIDIYGAIVHRPQPEKIHGFETLSLIRPILEELARTNASIRKHNRRAANAKPVTTRGQSDKQFEAELLSDSLPIAYAPSPVALKMWTEWKPPTVPKELIQYRDMLLSELRRMLGSDIMSQGGDTPHRISATEAQWRGTFQGDRLGRRKQVVSDMLSWMGRNIALLYRQFGDEIVPVKVVGLDGIEIRQLNPSSIPEDLIVTLDIEAVTEEKQNADMQAALVISQAIFAQAPELANPVELFRMLFKRAGFRNPDKYFNPLGQPSLRIAQEEGGEGGGIAPLPGNSPAPLVGAAGGPDRGSAAG